MTSLLLALALAASPGVAEYEAAVQLRPKRASVDYIKELRPGISPRYAWKLGRLVDYWAGRYRLDPDLMIAIIRTESYFEPNTKACWPAPWKPEGITCDHGLAQINEVWVKEWNLDPDRLVMDDSYNIAIQARLLAQLKRQWAADDLFWYGRYHNADIRKKAVYLSKLERYGYTP